MNPNTLLPEIERELQKQVSRLNDTHYAPFHEMLTYHMGWTGEGAGAEATGKRIRPLLVLLTAAACGADWQKALPAAAAIELIHNFSLVHDDVQDNSSKRRGRDTVWVKWGVPMAINAGDALFVLANQALLDISEHYPAEITLQAAQIFQNTCLELTKGQYLDMSYQTRQDLSVDDYWRMNSGKTAALLSACCHIGALLGGAEEPRQDSFRSFGHYLGLAFQVQDDILGIWGDESVTGKSVASDLVEGKKSLPVLIGLSKNGKFAERWRAGSIPPEEVEQLASQLAAESAYGSSKEFAIQLTDFALNTLRDADPEGDAGQTLLDLAESLLKRNA
jgi:geranylgeranyl diphosphate synthase, type I